MRTRLEAGKSHNGRIGHSSEPPQA
jgi:hypothetical protein